METPTATGDRIKGGTRSFGDGLREEFGPPLRFAAVTLLFTLAILSVSLPARTDGSTLFWFWVVILVVGGPVRAYGARAKGHAYQLAVLVVNWVLAAWFGGLVWARLAFGLRSGLLDALGWSLPIPKPQYLLLAGLTLYVVYSLAARWRLRGRTTT